MASKIATRKEQARGSIKRKGGDNGHAIRSNALGEQPDSGFPPMMMQRQMGNKGTQVWLAKQGMVQHLQAKLKIGQPNDKYEQEADRMAELVTGMNETSIPPGNKEEKENKIHSKPIDEEVNPLVQREGVPEEQKVFQSKQLQDRTTESSRGIESKISAVPSSGQPLPKSVRAYFEPRFGHDFGHIRLHTDNYSAKSAQGINAKAFTMGRNIVFGSGQYAPQTREGKKLLAHELTHTIQQNSAISEKRTATESSLRLGLPIIQRTLDVTDAITYNRNTLGGNDQFIRYIKFLLNRTLDIELPMVSTIDEAFVRALARYQEERRLPRPHDGKVGSQTRSAIATDLRTIISGTTGGASRRALRAAQKIINIYARNKILFAWWAGDCRDNNRNNSVDMDDLSERTKRDGWPSPHRPYRGFRTIAGTCRTATGRTLTTSAFDTNTPVKYKVCADIVSQAYRQAGIMSSTTRSVVRILSHFQRSRHCDVWQPGDTNFPATYLPGDFICTASGHHGHAGIVVRGETTNSGSVRPVVVHLPGSSMQIDRGMYDPTRTSDIRLERWPTQRWIPSLLYLGRSRR